MNTNGNLLKRMFSSDVIDPPKGEEFLGSRDVSSAQLFALICVHWRFSSAWFQLSAQAVAASRHHRVPHFAPLAKDELGEHGAMVFSAGIDCVITHP